MSLISKSARVLANHRASRALTPCKETPPKLALRTKISSRSGKTPTETFLSSLLPSLNMQS
jgi:hypothetical protein